MPSLHHLASTCSFTLLLIAGSLGVAAQGADNAKPAAVPPPVAAPETVWETITAAAGTLSIARVKDAYATPPALLRVARGLNPTYDVLRWRWHSRASAGDAQSGEVVLVGGEVVAAALPPADAAGEVANPTTDQDLDAWMGYIESGQQEFIALYVTRCLDLDLDFPGGDLALWQTALIGSLNQAHQRLESTQLKPLLTKRFAGEFAPATVVARVAPMRIKGTSLARQPWFRSLTLTLDDAKHEQGSPWLPGVKHTLAPLAMDTLVLRFSTGPFANIDAVDAFEPAYDTEYFNLSRLPAPAKGGRPPTAADIAALLEIRWEMDSTFIWGRTRYHPETNLMIVSGSDDEIITAKGIFAVLTGAAAAPSSPLDDRLARIAEIADTLKEIRAALPAKVEGGAKVEGEDQGAAK